MDCVKSSLHRLVNVMSRDEQLSFILQNRNENESIWLNLQTIKCNKRADVSRRNYLAACVVGEAKAVVVIYEMIKLHLM